MGMDIAWLVVDVVLALAPLLGCERLTKLPSRLVLGATHRLVLSAHTPFLLLQRRPRIGPFAAIPDARRLLLGGARPALELLRPARREVMVGRVRHRIDAGVRHGIPGRLIGRSLL